MAAPVVHATTQRLYRDLPEVYRAADVQPESAEGWPLLRFLSLVVDIAGALEDLADRIDHLPGQTGSDLVDPDTADPAWLPWLAQLVGTTIDTTDPVATQRANIAGADAEERRRGSRAHLAAVVAAELTGTQFVRIHSHDDGDPFRVSVETFNDETPDATWSDIEQNLPTWDHLEGADSWFGVTQPVIYIVTQPLRPAGVDLHVRPYRVWWKTTQADLNTWADWHAAGTWSALMATRP